MSAEQTLHKLMYSLRKAITSKAEKVSDLVPKIGGGIGPRRKLFNAALKVRQQTDKQFRVVLKQIAGNDPVMRKRIR